MSTAKYTVRTRKAGKPDSFLNCATWADANKAAAMARCAGYTASITKGALT